MVLGFFAGLVLGFFAGLVAGVVAVLEGAGGVVDVGLGADEAAAPGSAGSKYKRETLSAAANTNADPPTSAYGVTG